MQVLGKLTNREEIFLHNQARKVATFEPGRLKLQEKIVNFMFHMQKFDGLSKSSPLNGLLEKNMQIDFQLNTYVFTITFFIFVIDSIVIYAMMMTDIEERTYEFAMLRTLGFKNTSLITLITV